MVLAETLAHTLNLCTIHVKVYYNRTFFSSKTSYFTFEITAWQQQVHCSYLFFCCVAKSVNNVISNFMHNHIHNEMHYLCIPPLEDALLKLESLLYLCVVYCANGLKNLSDISICFHWEFDRISGFQSNSWHTE